MSFDVHSPHATRTRVPFFRHESEGAHSLASWIAHSKIQLYLRILSEIEIRAVKNNTEPAKEFIADKAVPEILEKRCAPMNIFCGIYKEGASRDTLAKLEDAIEDNLAHIQNTVIQAFQHLDKYGQHELRQKKVRKNVILKAVTIEDPNIKSFLMGIFKECYQFIVKKPLGSQSMPEIPSISSIAFRRASTRDRLKDEDIFSPRQSDSLYPYGASDHSSSGDSWEELSGDEDDNYIIGFCDEKKTQETANLIQL